MRRLPASVRPARCCVVCFELHLKPTHQSSLIPLVLSLSPDSGSPWIVVPSSGIAACAGLKASLAMSAPPAAPSREVFRATGRRREELWNLLGTCRRVSHPEIAEGKTRWLRSASGNDLNGIEPVPAYLLLPDKRPTASGPALYPRATALTVSAGKPPGTEGLARLRAVTLQRLSRWRSTTVFFGRKHDENGSIGGIRSSVCFGKARCSGA